MIRVVVVGDSTLDVTARLALPPRPGGDVPARISLASGGQGANVAVRLARWGTSVRLVSAIADDDAGRLLSASLEAERLELARLPAERSGVVVALVDSAGERTMLSDRVTLAPGALATALAGAAWVHCSAYALADEATADSMAAALASLPATVVVSVGGGSLPPDAEAAARVRHRLAQARARLLVFGRDEAGSLLDATLPSEPAAADALQRAVPGAIAVVTGGAGGSAAAGPGYALSVPAEQLPGPVVDATGAGDAYAATLIALLLDAAWPPGATVLRAAMEAASRAGARVARVVGAQAPVAGEAGGVA